MTTVISLASRRAVPTTPPTTGTPDSIQLYADAHNALSMALRYLRAPSGNVPGAARKAGQALAALRRLQVSERAAPADPCTGCPDNFPLPEVVDFFDRAVIAGYIERRTACDLCPAGRKPCMTSGRA